MDWVKIGKLLVLAVVTALGISCSKSSTPGAFQGKTIDAVEVVVQLPWENGGTKRTTTDPAVINRLLTCLKPNRVDPSEGVAKWLIKLHSKGEVVETVWVYPYGEWGYIGENSVGLSKELPKIIQEIVESTPATHTGTAQPTTGASHSWVEPMFAPQDLKMSVPKQLPKELAKSDAFLAVLRWHEYASSNSVRMTWFIHGGLNVAMVCSIDLDSGEWLTSREVYDWASQGTKKGCLDAEGLAAVKKLAEKLPASVDSIDPTFAVLVSMPAGEHRSLRIYNRRQLPEPVEKLYASTGAYIDTTDYDVKSSSQPACAKQGLILLGITRTKDKYYYRFLAAKPIKTPFNVYIQGGVTDNDPPEYRMILTVRKTAASVRERRIKALAGSLDRVKRKYAQAALKGGAHSRSASTKAKTDAATTQPALPRPMLEELGEFFTIRAQAGSWDALVKKVKPTFTWGGCDMMWVGRDKKGSPQFTLDRAYIYKPKGKPARWVLLKYQDSYVAYDKVWSEFGSNYLRGVAKLHEKVPETDHGSGQYAVVLSIGSKGGTVYEIGWQAAKCSGSGQVIAQRRLFVLRDSKGKWHFVGEGPICTSGKMGAAYCYWNTLQSRITWTGKSDAPVRIELTWKHVRSQLTPSDDDPIVPKRDMITYRNAAVAGALAAKSRRLLKRPYMLAKKGDTFEKIAHHLSTWTFGWDTNRGDDRRFIQAMWRKGLARLNPKLPREKIPAGTRIRLLTYAETIKHVEKCRKAATRPNAWIDRVRQRPRRAAAG